MYACHRRACGVLLVGAIALAVGLASVLQPGVLSQANFRGVAVGLAGVILVFWGLLWLVLVPHEVRTPTSQSVDR